MIELSYEQKEDLGFKYVRDLLEPACPYGMRRLRAEGFYARRDELERELENVSILCAALDADEAAVLDLRAALGGLKELSGTVAACEGRALTEVELFDLTAFCVRLRTLIPRAEALPGYDGLDGVRFARVDAALAILDPSESGRLSFYVEDARTDALLAARERKRELERLLRAPDADREALLPQRQEAAKAEEDALADVYRGMSEALREHLGALRACMEAAGRLDAAIAKALVAKRFGCCRPALGGDTLSLTDAVHPQIAAALASRGRSFTPITVELSRGVTVLTGANMGGKSVAMKTIMLNAALALGGCFVFAASASVPMFEHLELINRDFSNAAEGLSSFGGEILRFNAAAEQLGSGLSFIAMDEFARGTNAREGAAIARAAVRYLSDKNAVTLLATHYDGTAEFAVRHYQVKGLKRLDASDDASGTGADRLRRIENAMDYGLIEVEPGTECPRDALRICHMLGMDAEILSFIEREGRSAGQNESKT
ncbi:MAG: hypothetical protein E7422_01805 [Ruminococcaceae bacterium]|nr:hypothetical protein [Oscillospiraceae bacterium]